VSLVGLGIIYSKQNCQNFITAYRANQSGTKQLQRPTVLNDKCQFAPELGVSLVSSLTKSTSGINCRNDMPDKNLPTKENH